MDEHIPDWSRTDAADAGREADYNISLLVEESRISANKLVLLLHCGYFKALFCSPLTTPEQTEFSLKDLSAVAVEMVMDSLHGGDLPLNMENIVPVLRAASYLICQPVVAACTAFLLNNISPGNAIGIWNLCGWFYLTEVAEKTLEFLHKNFSDVAEEEEFLSLSSSQLSQLIASDHLRTCNELVVWTAVSRWLASSSATVEETASVLRNIRFGLLDEETFTELIRDHKIFQSDSQEIQAMIREWRSFFRLFDPSDPSSDIEGLGDLFSPDFAMPRYPSEFLFVFGGFAVNAPSSNIEVYDVRSRRWCSVDLQLPHRMAYATAQVVNGEAYLMGGVVQDDPGQEQRHSSSTYTININQKTITQSHTLLEARNFACSAVVDNVIYIFGGKAQPDSEDRMNSCERLDLSLPNPMWEQIQPLRMRRSDAGAAYLNGKIYVVGGFNGAFSLDTVEVYTLRTGNWSFPPRLIRRRSGLACVAFQGELYVAGGTNGGMHRLRTVEKYNPRTRRWTLIAPMIHPRSNFCMQVVEGAITVCGGYDGTGVLPACEVYNKETNTWQLFTPMDLPKSGTASIVLDRTSLSPSRQGEYVYPDRRCLVAEQVYKIRQQAEYLSLMVEPLASDVYEEDEEDEESYDEDFNAEMAFVLDQNYL